MSYYENTREIVEKPDLSVKPHSTVRWQTMIQIPDKYKLILLAVSLTTCTLTYFLPYTSRNLVSINNLPAPVDRYCRSIQQKFRNECKTKDETSLQCTDLRYDVEDCKSAIITAYKRINMKCLGYSVQVQMCLRDCLEESSEDSEQNESRVDCNKVCEVKADFLKGCEKEIVAKELKSYGIQDIISLDR